MSNDPQHLASAAVAIAPATTAFDKFLALGRFDNTFSVTWMYHCTHPHLKWTIQEKCVLEAKPADHKYYDHKLTAPGAPPVVFFLTNVDWTTRGPRRTTNYPRITGQDRVPRIDIHLSSFTSLAAASWFFVGHSFPYKRPGSSSVASKTVQVHVVLLRPDSTAAHKEWCENNLEQLDMREGENPLLWIEDGLIEDGLILRHAHTLTIKDTQHSLYLNLCVIGDVNFAPLDHHWNTSERNPSDKMKNAWPKRFKEHKKARIDARAEEKKAAEKAAAAKKASKKQAVESESEPLDSESESEKEAPKSKAPEKKWKKKSKKRVIRKSKKIEADARTSSVVELLLDAIQNEDEEAPNEKNPFVVDFN